MGERVVEWGGREWVMGRERDRVGRERESG